MLKHSSLVFISKSILPVFLLLQPVFGLAQTAEGNDAEMAAPVASPEQQGASTASTAAYLPGWPSHPPRQKIERRVDRVPPPPPGPYMSTAISGFEVDGTPRGFSANRHSAQARSSSDRSGQQTAARRRPATVPMATFNPDTPWPSNLRPPTRWQPETGYHYVNQQNRRTRDAHPYYSGMSRYNRGGRPYGGAGVNMPAMNTPAQQSDPQQQNTETGSATPAR